MQLITTENKLAGSKKALEIIEKGITSGEVNTLGLATGSTPETLYAELVKSDVDTKNVTTTNLDEYVGLAASDPNSYHYYMNDLLFSKKAFKESFLPNGEATDAEAECARYEEILSEHPIDIQVLGIGTNGHIGFNEPGTSDYTEVETDEAVYGKGAKRSTPEESIVAAHLARKAVAIADLEKRLVDDLEKNELW